MAKPGYEALTVKSNGRADRIITEIRVAHGFDPAAPPSPLPQQIKTNALWDTGATKSVISQQLAKDLGLTAVGAENVIHASGTSISPTYIVNFLLPGDVGIAGIVVTEFPSTGGFGAIIGMDVITLGDFVITNHNGLTCMSFRIPSQGQVDYVQEHSRQTFAGIGRNDPCPCGSGKKYRKCHGAV